MLCVADDHIRLRSILKLRHSNSSAQARLLNILAQSLLNCDSQTLENTEMEVWCLKTLEEDVQMMELLGLVKSRL